MHSAHLDTLTTILYVQLTLPNLNYKKKLIHFLMYHQATGSVTTSGTRTTVSKRLDRSDSPFRTNYDSSKRPYPAHALRAYEGDGVQVGWGNSLCIFWIKEIKLALQGFELRIVRPVSWPLLSCHSSQQTVRQ